ncbi:MAG: hypothetical protein ACOC41_07865 [Chitinivibrionales bacterium]
MQKRIFPILIALFSAAQAQTIVFRPVDAVGEPIRGVSANVQYFVNGDGERSLTVTDDENTGVVTFDCDNCAVNEWRTVTLIPPDTQAISPVVLFETPEEYVDISSNQNFVLDTTVEMSIKWEFSSSAEDSGRFLVPGLVYQILYDPPGDQSQAQLTEGVERTTSLSTRIATSLGAELTFGYSYSSPLFGFGGEFEVSTGVNYRQESENEFTVTIEETEQIETAATSNPETVGPGRGDVVVTQGVWVRWALGRAYRPDHPDAYEDGYIYKFFYAPIPGSGTVLKRVTYSYLSEEFSEHPQFIEHVKDVSVIDESTGRIKPDLIGTPRLSWVERTQISGDLPFTRTYTESQTQATTLTQEVELSASVMAKITSGGASAGGKLSMSFSTGSSQTSSTTHQRSFGLTYFDDEAWDVTVMDVYIDNQFGVYVFDVDSSQSLSSYPFEDLYSWQAVDFTVATDSVSKTALQDDTIRFTLDVLNTSASPHSSLSVLDPVGARVVQTSGASVSIDPVSVAAGKSSPAAMRIAVTPPSPGIYPIRIVLDDPRQAFTRSIELTAEFLALTEGVELIAQQRQHVLPYELPDTVEKTFSLTLQNTSEVERTIELGYANQSRGLQVQLPTQFNAVGSGGSRTFDVVLTGIGAALPFEVDIWAQLQNLPSTRKTVTLSMDTLPPQLTLLSPAAGDTLLAGQPDTIFWSSEGNIPEVNVEYSVNGGVDWTTLAADLDNAGSYVFTVPDVQSTTVHFRIRAGTDGAITASTGESVTILKSLSTVVLSRIKTSSFTIGLPGKHTVWLKAPFSAREAQLSLYDLSGRRVWQQKVANGTRIKNSLPLSTGKVYLVSIKAGQKRHNDRFVLLR